MRVRILRTWTTTLAQHIGKEAEIVGRVKSGQIEMVRLQLDDGTEPFLIDKADVRRVKGDRFAQAEIMDTERRGHIALSAD